MSRSTVKSMSGNAERTWVHHSSSWPRTSVPTASGFTRAVTWLTKSGDQYSNTACSSPREHGVAVGAEHRQVLRHVPIMVAANTRTPSVRGKRGTRPIVRSSGGTGTESAEASADDGGPWSGGGASAHDGWDGRSASPWGARADRPRPGRTRTPAREGAPMTSSDTPQSPAPPAPPPPAAPAQRRNLRRHDARSRSGRSCASSSAR